MSKTYIIGAGMTPLGKHLDLSVRDLTAQAVSAALADAGIDKNMVEAARPQNSAILGATFPNMIFKLM